MSRAPWVLLEPERARARGHQTLWSTTLGWRMVNPAMPPEWTVALGEGAELLADEYAVSRETQDALALDSHRKAATAWAAREFADEVVAVPGATLASDESIREDTTVDQLSQLRPAFRPDGTVTAGNSSPLNDGAAGLLLANGAGLAASGGWPLARIVSRAVSGVEPQRFGIGPVTAAARALERAGIGWSDLASVELNEALAAQSLACPGRVAVKPRGDLTLLGWRRHGGSYFRSPCRELLR